MDDGVISWDEQGNLQFINAQAARVLRLDATASQGRAITELFNVTRRIATSNKTGTSAQTRRSNL